MYHSSLYCAMSVSNANIRILDFMWNHQNSASYINCILQLRHAYVFCFHHTVQKTNAIFLFNFLIDTHPTTLRLWISTEGLKVKGTMVCSFILAFCVGVFSISAWLIQGRSTSEGRLDRTPQWLPFLRTALLSFYIWQVLVQMENVASQDCQHSQLLSHRCVDMQCEHTILVEPWYSARLKVITR